MSKRMMVSVVLVLVFCVSIIDFSFANNNLEMSAQSGNNMSVIRTNQEFREKTQNFCIHRELRIGEVWWSNSGDDGIEVNWKTKRIGKHAYDVNGNLLPAHIVPIFVQKKELIEAGIETLCFQ